MPIAKSQLSKKDYIEGINQKPEEIIENKQNNIKESTKSKNDTVLVSFRVDKNMQALIEDLAKGRGLGTKAGLLKQLIYEEKVKQNAKRTQTENLTF